MRTEDFESKIDSLPFGFGERPSDYSNEWLRSLPDDALRRILYAKHDCLDNLLANQIKDIWWERYATSCSEWLYYDKTYEGRKLTFIDFCGKSLINGECVWHDMNAFGHTPNRKLVCKRAYGDKLIVDVQIECSCGARIGDSNDYSRRIRLFGDAWWWPIVLVSKNKKKRKPFYKVCAEANHLMARHHCPMSEDYIRCICGREGSRYKLIPVE